MSETSNPSAPATGVTQLATNVAIGLAPVVAGYFNPLAGQIIGALVGEWQAYLRSRNLPADYDPTDADIAAFRADIAANSAAAIHARAEAEVAAARAAGATRA